MNVPEKSELRPFIACTAAMCIVYLSSWLQPYIVKETLELLRTGASRAGLVLSVELTAMALGSIALSRCAGDGPYRLIAMLAGMVAIVGAALSVAASGYWLLISARLLAGVGEGGVLMVSTTVLAQMSFPDRAYAKVLFVNNLFGVALSFVMQMLDEVANGRSIAFPILLLIQVALYPVMLLLPRKLRVTQANNRDSAPSIHGYSVRVMFLAAAVIVIAATTNSVWSFYFALGQQNGMDSRTVSHSIEYAVVASSLGAVLAMMLGTRVGRFAPLAMGLCAQTGAIAVMSMSSNTLSFEIASDFYFVGGFLAMPYFFGYGAAENLSGRGAAIVGAAYSLAGAVSPYLGGVMIERFGLHSIAWLVAGASALATGIFFWLDTTRDRRQSTCAPMG